MHQQQAPTMDPSAAIPRSLRHLAGVVLVWAVLLAGCGGGGSGGESGTGQVSAPTDNQPSVVASLRPDVKKLTVAQEAEVAVDTDGTVTVPASLGLRAGDVLLLAERAVKLGAQGATSADGRGMTFEHQEPSLDEVYSSIVLNGSSDGLQPEALAAAQGAPDRLHRLDWTPNTGNGCKPASGNFFGISGSSGITCVYNAQDKGTDPKAKRPTVNFESKITVGARWSFKNYDIIRRKGTATLSFESDGLAVLQLGAKTAFGTYGPLAESSACTSSLNNSLRQVVTTGRVRIGTLSWLLGSSGFRLNVPLCLALGARGSAAWEIFRVAPSIRYTVQFQDDQAPTVTATPSVGRIDNPGQDAVFDFNPAGTSVSAMGMAVAGELAFEASIELSDAFKLVGVGLENRFIGRAGAEGRLAAAVIGNSVTTGELQASPLACIRWTAGGDYELSAHFWVARSRSLVSKVPVFKHKLGEASQRYGLCLRASAAVQAPMVPAAAGLGHTLAVSATVTAAPTSNDVVYAEAPGGELLFIDQKTGELLCKDSLGAKGQAACSFSTPKERSYLIIARYAGDDRYSTVDSPAAALEVKRPVYPTVTTITAGAAPAMSTRFSARVLPDNVSTALPVSGQVSFRTADTGQVLCVQTLDAEAQAQCDVSFSVIGPPTRRVVATYSGSADFKASTSSELVHQLGGDHTVDISALGPDPAGAKRLKRCEQEVVTQASGNFSGSGTITNDRCNTDVAPYLRCTGPGCGRDRFVATAWHIRTVSTMGCYPVPGNLCPAGLVQETENRWADATGNYVISADNPPQYIERQADLLNWRYPGLPSGEHPNVYAIEHDSNYVWVRLAEGEWMTPIWGAGAGMMSLSARGAIRTNYRAMGDIQPGWYRNTGDWARHEQFVEYLVYDRLTRQTTTVNFSFTLE